MAEKTVFKPAGILLPRFDGGEGSYEKWAVIACDQFTSDPSYWLEIERIIGTSPSTYDYILPEAYLETEREEEKVADLRVKMQSVDSSPLSISSPSVSGYVYVERTLTGGKVRHGILGMVDLECYDYSQNSNAEIRATEQTVPERIPPRSALRGLATIELPHAMIFTDDRSSLFETAHNIAHGCEVVYDFDLMQGGGHIKGYAIIGDAADTLSAAIAENESCCTLPYAVGDGNHSLAAAKAHYESIKASGDDEALSHPARYALCEVVSIYDDAIEFEPIHRILKNVDPSDVLAAIGEIATVGHGAQSTRIITADSETVYTFTAATHTMTVGTLQDFIDSYVKANPGAECDYIHGEKELRSLVDGRSVAFMFDGFDKSMLFSYIKNGPMPRKTFSMGDARSKRYYLESRLIVKR